MDIITGTILGGTLLLAIMFYILTIVLLSLKARRGAMASDSKGMKHLKFQEWNHVYNEYVVR